MDNQPLLLSHIVHFLNDVLQTNRYSVDERGGVFKPSERPVQRIGLALEPSAEIGSWVRSEQLDALWLHRPWKLNLNNLPADVGVLMNHLPFDESMTTGYNVRLANALALQVVDELGYKQETDKSVTLLPKRPIGMIGLLGEDVPERSFQAWVDLITAEFGGYDQVEESQVRSHKGVAIVGAMNSSLLHEAHERGVSLYLTGEYRKGAQATVDETGLAIIAIGHQRTEEWGLRALRNVLLEQWSGLDVVLG